ncbi:MAG: hypothetical protein M1829_004550 [Trizodia sp. TS-e1964]|nr:MAG: hypothetical protein M1829_004550 [Trizodia sp. TS-e1964]
MALSKTTKDLLMEVIKTYSPNLMVHPYMRQSAHAAPSDTPESIASTVIAMLPRLHVLVIGPGLGRDTLMQETCALIIQAARKQRLPIVLDADGLYLIQSKPGLIEGYQNCILTPNIVEFERLAKALNVDILIEDESYQCERLAIVLRGVTIIKKGSKDYISNGRQTLVSDIEGGLKRSGGQGDTLTGLLATLLGWRKAYIDQIWDHEDEISYSELLPLVAFGGSSLTRECSRLAFEKKGRSMQASDLTEEIAQAFQNLLEDKD